MIIPSDSIFSLLSWLQYIFVRLCLLLGFISIAPILILLLLDPVVYVFRLFQDLLPSSSSGPNSSNNRRSGSSAAVNSPPSGMTTVTSTPNATADGTGIIISTMETETKGVTTAVDLQAN